MFIKHNYNNNNRENFLFIEGKRVIKIYLKSHDFQEGNSREYVNPLDRRTFTVNE